MRQIVADLDVDSYAKRVNAITFFLGQRLAVICHITNATIGIAVIRFVIRQFDK